MDEPKKLVDMLNRFAQKKLGPEKVEEINQDTVVLKEVLDPHFDGVLYCALLLMGMGEDVETVLYNMFMAGGLLYKNHIDQKPPFNEQVDT